MGAVVTANTLEAYKLIHAGQEALMEMENEGLTIDIAHCKKQSKRLQKIIKRKRETILRHPEGKKWKRVFRRKMNLQSNDQVAAVLYDHMDYECEEKTPSGKYSTSEESLMKTGSSMVKSLIDYRGLKKLKNTYINGYLEESVDGKLYPFFHLNIVDSFRSSCSKINFQNQPIRIPWKAEIVRKSVIAEKDFMLVEKDYGSQEVRVGTCYHQDPAMIKYNSDPTTDMHRDMCMRCFKLDMGEWTKDARYSAKNMFVFPQFYGDWYGNNARDMWAFIDKVSMQTKQGVAMKAHLRKHGIRSYEKFEKHIASVEEYFWEELFPDYAQWKKDHYKFYKKNGYVDYLTGFRVSGVMSKNEVINYPVQGAAFHCLLLALIIITRRCIEEGLRSRPIGQIHDSIVSKVHREEYNYYLKMCYDVMQKEVPKIWPWIIVPLEVEIETSPLEKSWYEKKEVLPGNPCHKCGALYLYRKTIDGKGMVVTCPRCGHEIHKSYRTIH